MSAFIVSCRARLALAVVLSLAHAAADAQPITWSARAGLASAWMLRGVRLSDDGAPLVFAGVDGYAGALGGGISTMRLRAYDGRWTDAWTVHGGADWRLSADTSASVDLQRLRYGASLADWDGTQLSAGFGFGDWGALTWNRQRLRDATLDADSLDGALRWPLSPAWRLAAGLGYTWHGWGAPYVYGQAALEWHLGVARLQVQRTWTRGAGPGVAGPAAAPRWVGSASWVF